MRKSIVVKPNHTEVYWTYIVRARPSRMAGYVYKALSRSDSGLVKIEIQENVGAFTFWISNLVDFRRIPAVSKSDKMPAYEKPPKGKKIKQAVEEIVNSLQSGTPCVVEDSPKIYPVIAAVVLTGINPIVIERTPPQITIRKENAGLAESSDL